jgi:hypothetical protein
MTDVRVRASLAPADPLMRALGRQNREQVLTSRPSAATTLEALELTNGQSLDTLLTRGAEMWLRENPSIDSETLVAKIFERALNRPPTPEELNASVALVGSPETAEGVADLLWSLTMLPEFQLIY